MALRRDDDEPGRDSSSTVSNAARLILPDYAS
jgi:hypothetical protein